MSVVHEWNHESVRALARALNLSTEKFARRLGVTKKTVLTWTNPHSTVEIRADNRNELDKLLTSSPHCVQARFDKLMGFASGAGETSVPQPIPATLISDTAGVHHDTHQVPVLAACTSDGEVDAVDLPRRTVITGLGASAFLAVVGGPASAADISTAPEPAAKTPADWVEHFRTEWLEMITRDNLHGSGSVLPRMETALAEIGRLRDRRAADSRELQRLRVLYGESISWLHQDARDWDRARAWAEKATNWALELNDPACISLVSIRKSQIACDQGDGQGAVDSAAAAVTHAPPGTRFGAVATLFAAWGHALLRDAYSSACGFERARELAAAADPDADWGFFLDDAYIDIHEATAHLVLGRPRTAISRFESAIAAMPDSYARDRGLYRGRLGLAYAAAGDSAAAARASLEAMRTGLATRSMRVLAPVQHLREAMDPDSVDPDIQAFLGATDHWAVRA
ncbi:hypothetical protein IU487_33045 [Nocardia puris]|uniref:hypothetical protein n=1 Tax=Nocardia puris TaxID=208602 RepID=UPI0018948B10|nr:hypothetical protein [Nocardia puris]MBF6215828.1 hypothetical protein [Nocardia puris]